MTRAPRSVGAAMTLLAVTLDALACSSQGAQTPASATPHAVQEPAAAAGPEDAAPVDAGLAAVAASTAADAGRDDDDPPLPGEAGWETRTYREEIWDAGGVLAQLTWVLHEGANKARLKVSSRTREPGKYYRAGTWMNVPRDVEWAWPPPVTTTFLGERAGPASFRFVAQGELPGDYLAPTLRLDCRTKPEALRPAGVGFAAKMYLPPGQDLVERVIDGVQDHSKHHNYRDFWVPASIASVTSSVCERKWEVPSVGSSPRSSPSWPLVFAAATTTSPGVERIRAEGTLRWISLHPGETRTDRGSADGGARAPGADAVNDAALLDASVGAANDLDESPRTYRDIVMDEDTGFRRLTWVVRGGDKPQLRVLRQKPVPGVRNPLWWSTNLPVEDDYSWAPPITTTTFTGTRVEKGSFRFVADGHAPGPDLGGVLQLSCRTSQVAVRPTNAVAIATLLAIRADDPNHVRTMPDPVLWRWEPSNVDIETACVCERSWLSRPEVDASAPAYPWYAYPGNVRQVPPQPDRPLVFVAPTRHASGVGWLDRGDGQGGTLRWIPLGT
jgi:hypothetical protein